MSHLAVKADRHRIARKKTCYTNSATQFEAINLNRKTIQRWQLIPQNMLKFNFPRHSASLFSCSLPLIIQQTSPQLSKYAYLIVTLTSDFKMSKEALYLCSMEQQTQRDWLSFSQHYAVFRSTM
jgi:hypothetical protein